MVGKLIAWAYEYNYELTFGETLRSADEARFNAEASKGIRRSLHTIGLAIDLNLFIEGVYQRNSDTYLPLGLHWEFLGGSWGGRFSRPDGNHFSLSHEGVR